MMCLKQKIIFLVAQEKYTHSTNQILFQRIDFISDDIDKFDMLEKLLKMAYTKIDENDNMFFSKLLINKKCIFTVDSATAMLNATFK